jgi:hypothetical protein
MADQAVSEMISAFAAGCMDKENFIHFNNYIRNKGELPYKELGRFQIITSMLPAILEQEEPDPDLKNKVARKLISMQDEIKERIKSQKQKNIDAARAETKTEDAIEAAAEPKRIVIKETFADLTQPKTPLIKPDVLPEKNFMIPDNKLFSDKVTQPVEIPSQTPLWIAVVILFLIIITIGYFSFTTISELKNTIAKTENNLTAAKSEWRSTNEFISKNVALVEFFNNTNVWIINMTGVDPLMKISGKLLVAMDAREALIQINNLPTLTPEYSYQLWLTTKNQIYSMGFFFVEPGSKYIKLISIPVIAKDQILEFSVTLEPRSGSVVPSGQVYATGTIEQTAVKPTKSKK